MQQVEQEEKNQHSGFLPAFTLPSIGFTFVSYWMQQVEQEEKNQHSGFLYDKVEVNF
jgi:hypothetical protein